VLAPAPRGEHRPATSSPGGGSLRTVRLLERDDDLAVLCAQLRSANEGRGGVTIVRGEPGAGKSSLLHAFAEDHVGGMPVLWGACDPLTTPRPLGPIHDLVTELGDEVTSVLRSATQTHEIFTAVFEHLRLHPSVLVVDDLHWADQGTVELLRFLLRRIRVTGSMVIGASRDDEVGTGHPLRSLFGDVARSPDAHTITLRPLSTAAVGDLVEDRPIDPAWLHRLTAGNPFYVVEMLDHDDEEIPRTVRDAILSRTHGLDVDGWDLLHLLACAPQALADHLLAPLGVGLPALRSLDRAGLIRRDPRGIAFRHDLCRMAIVGTLPPGGEVSFHRRMLDALERSGSVDPAVLAHHAAGAGDAGRTLRYATDAGRAAARSGAHTQAAAFFLTALERGAPTSLEEADLLELLAGEQYLIDRLEQAIAASERAMQLREESSDPVGVSVNHHALAVYQWYNANREDAERHAAAAEAVLTERPTPASQADLGHLGHALVTQAYLAFQANDTGQARRLLGRAADVGADDPALTVRARLLTGICDVVEGAGESREATLAIVDAAGDHLDEIYSSTYSNIAYLDVEQRRLRNAAELLGYTLPLTLERDLPICRVWQLGARGRMKLMRGDWAEALADAELVLDAPSAPLARTWPHLVRGLVALRRGADADADSDLQAAWALACRFGEPIRLLPAAAALVERSWLRGIADDRLAECRAVLAGATGEGLAWARGELATWLRRLDADLGSVPSGDALPGDVAEPFSLQLAGRHEEAAALWATLPAPYDQALALVDAGTPESVRAGLDLLDRLGADDVAAKVRHDLRRQGATTIPSRRRQATLANPAGLTGRQVEILRLLADGSTNAEIAERLFISSKTVEHHVSALLAKLHAPSRRDAVRRAADLGILP
jgi:DNA-binding CsgD family transcriptional regulator/tetratricopeptide (TPR) repeat protein